MSPDQLISFAHGEEIGRPAASRILATLIEASPLAIVTFDPEGVVTMWNPAAEAIFGWSENEALGTRLPFVPAEKQHEFRALLRRAMHGEVFTEPELHRRRADGSPIVVSVSTAPLRRPDGTIFGVLSILMDVTERKAAGESRARLTMAVDRAGENIVVTTMGQVLRRLIGEEIELPADLSPSLCRVMADPGNGTALPAEDEEVVRRFAREIVDRH